MTHSGSHFSGRARPYGPDGGRTRGERRRSVQDAKAHKEADGSSGQDSGLRKRRVIKG